MSLKRHRRSPIGRELSTNVQSSDVQRHVAPMGSQKGVEQLEVEHENTDDAGKGDEGSRLNRAC